MIRIPLLALASLCTLTACATAEPVSLAPKAAAESRAAPTDPLLRKFALAQCLRLHFERQGWDTSDLKGIAGGFVELGTSGPETYQAIVDALEAWDEDIPTKQNLDPSLNRCFHMERNPELARLLGLE